MLAVKCSYIISHHCVIVLIAAMEPEPDDHDRSLADGSGDTSEGDGCGFSALFRRKHRKNSDSEVQPVIEDDGMTAAAMATSGFEDNDVLQQSSATLQIPECVLFVVSTRSSATTEIATDLETAIQGHSRSSVVVPINASYMTSY